MELINFPLLSETEHQELRQDHQDLGMVVDYLQQSKLQKEAPPDAIDPKKRKALLAAVDHVESLRSRLYSEAFRGVEHI